LEKSSNQTIETLNETPCLPGVFFRGLFIHIFNRGIFSWGIISGIFYRWDLYKIPVPISLLDTSTKKPMPSAPFSTKRQMVQELGSSNNDMAGFIELLHWNSLTFT